MKDKSRTLYPAVSLKCGNWHVSGIVSVPDHNMFAISSDSDRVLVYRHTPEFAPVGAFDKHKTRVNGVVHLFDDILASVDEAGFLLTWSATTGSVRSGCRVSEGGCWAITKAGASVILVGTTTGEIILVSHEGAKNLAVNERATAENSVWIYGICAHSNIFVAIDRTNVKIWDYGDDQLFGNITIDNEKILAVAVSDEFVVMGGEDGEIYVHGRPDGFNFNLLKTIDLQSSGHLEHDYTRIFDLSFLNEDILMVTTDDSGLFFVSVESGKCISHYQVENSKGLYRTTVLSDGRMCIGGLRGYCAIFDTPPEVQSYMGKCLPPIKEEKSTVSVNNIGDINTMQLEKKVQNMESEIEELKVQNKELQLQNKEQAVRIAIMELSKLKEDGNTEVMKVQLKKQQEKIAELEQQNSKRRRIAVEEWTEAPVKSYEADDAAYAID